MSSWGDRERGGFLSLGGLESFESLPMTYVWLNWDAPDMGGFRRKLRPFSPARFLTSLQYSIVSFNFNFKRRSAL